MTAHSTTPPDLRAKVLASAAPHHQAAFVSLLTGLLEVLDSPDAVQLLDEIAFVVGRRLSRHEVCILLLVLLKAAHLDDLDALGKALQPQFYGPSGAPVGSDPSRRYRPPSLTPEQQRRADRLPDFDLPEGAFHAWLGMESAPLDERKRQVWRGFQSFDPGTQHAFVHRLYQDGYLAAFLESRREAA